MAISPFEPQATSPQVLRYMVAVADTGTFRAAARLAHVSQPSLSNAIAGWERSLGVQLFERGHRGVRLTVVGERVIAAAREALLALERVERMADDMTPPFYGPVRLGVIPTVAPSLLPAVHEAMRAEEDEVDLAIVEDMTQGLVEGLEHGQIDLALVAELPGMRDHWQVIPCFEEPFRLAVPNGHQLAAKESVRVADLPRDELILLDEGHCLRDQALAVCRLHSATQQRYRATSLETLRHLVAVGHGITLLPDLICRQGLPDIAVRPIIGKHSRTIIAICRRSDPRFEAYAYLTTRVRERIKPYLSHR